jgi:uncharacterized protein
MKIKIEKANPNRLKELDVDNWSSWECKVSTFKWKYDEEEVAYILEGRVKVKTDFEEVEIKKGDIVTFPQGLKCTWNILENLKKVYTFN